MVSSLLVARSALVSVTTNSPLNQLLTCSAPSPSKLSPTRALLLVELVAVVHTQVAVAVSLIAPTARMTVALVVLLLLTILMLLESTSRLTIAVSSWMLSPAAITPSLRNRVLSLLLASHACPPLISPWHPSASRLRTLLTLTSMFFLVSWLTSLTLQ